jgi:endonuclease-3
MKPAREIIEQVRKLCVRGVFPGTNGEEVASWQPDPFHVLISTVLSQRTRDQNTYVASSRLFAVYDTPQELMHAPLDRLEELVRPAGFPKAKARAIKGIAKRIIEEHGGRVPSTIEELMTLPMVGRKTANCVRAYAFRIPSVCVDTHVHRISNRIGLAVSDDPEGTEEQLMKVVPRDLWIDVNSLFVRFGQKVCLPRRPRCWECPLTGCCDYYAKYRPEPPGKRSSRKVVSRVR